jgi:hypothetical protein
MLRRFVRKAVGIAYGLNDLEPTHPDAEPLILMARRLGPSGTCRSQGSAATISLRGLGRTARNCFASPHVG